MRYAVIGGDMRFAHLARMLAGAGWETAAFLQEQANSDSAPLSELKDCERIITNWPLRWPLSKEKTSEGEIFTRIASGSTLLLCGPDFPEEKREGLRYVNLWEDERLLTENAYLTAEAAVAAAQRRRGGSFEQLPCAVIGYGRIGRALTEILKDLGAELLLLSRTEEKRRLARENGASAEELRRVGKALHGRKLIFNTAPSRVLDREALLSIDQDALLMELASPPYGFDPEEALALGVNACRETGLPGRHCPLSAARALYHAVLRWEEGEKNG